MAHEPPKSSPPMAGYDRPKAAGEVAVQAAPSVAAPCVRTLVMTGGTEPTVVRATLAEGDDASGWSLTLAYDYEGVRFEGLTFEADGKLFEVSSRDGRTLTLEVA